MNDVDKYLPWIQPQHLEPSYIESIKEEYQSNPLGGVILDDFFNENVIVKLQNVIAREALFRCVYKLYSDSSKSVPEEIFLNASEEDRFHHVNIIDKVKPEYSLSHNWLTYIRFLHFYNTQLPMFFGKITGNRLMQGDNMIQSNRLENSLNKHNDVQPGRRLTTILYLSSDWKPEFGGALHICQKNGLERIIDVKCNRMVFFEPNVESSHYVAIRSELARNKTRDCYVSWFHEKQ
jgi:hypothetical protein